MDKEQAKRKLEQLIEKEEKIKKRRKELEKILEENTDEEADNDEKYLLFYDICNIYI